MTEKNPWKRLGTRLIYQNAWLSLREDQVIRPDGKPGIYSVVETRIATAIVAIDADKNVYLVGQYRYPTDVYSWELPEGGTDPGEAPLAAAQRELREEAGLIADAWTQLGGEVHLSNCISSEVGYFYLAEDLHATASQPEGTEVLQVRRLPFGECVAMVDSGEIVDAMSIIGILRAERFLRDRS